MNAEAIMSRVKEIISALEEAAKNPARTIKASIERTGRRAVGCFPLYTPDELIYAAGLLPVGLWGGQTDIKQADKFLQSFCCSIMRENMELGMRGLYDFLAAVIIPTYCDTLKCICANWPSAAPKTRLIPMVYPQNRAIPAGIAYLVDELARVKKELESIIGREISGPDLEAAIAVYEDFRETMRRFTDLVNQYPNTINVKTRHMIIKASYFMDKAEHAAMVRELLDELEKLPPEEFKGVRVVPSGILLDTESLLDAFVENEIMFAADDLAHESRQFRTSVRTEGPTLERLALRMADHDGCSLLYDQAKAHGRVLIDLAGKTKADGVVVCMMKFCDPEEFDYPILKKEIDEAGMPMLYLEIEQKMDSVEPLRTRIQSFAEMIG